MIFGISSGSVVSLDAAAVIPGMTKVVVYEPALIVDDSRQPVPADYTEHLTTLAVEGKHDEAVAYFLMQALGIPAEYIGGMKQDQATWSGMTGVAETIAYDAAFVGTLMQGNPLPTDRWVKVTVSALMRWPKSCHTPAATRSKGKPTWLTPTCSPRSSSHSSSNHTS